MLARFVLGAHQEEYGPHALVGVRGQLCPLRARRRQASAQTNQQQLRVFEVRDSQVGERGPGGQGNEARADLLHQTLGHIVPGDLESLREVERGPVDDLLQ